jgi:DNA-binding CsgD family transcriptional regulator
MIFTVRFPGGGTLVGRAAEVSALQAAFGDERTRLVLIAGEAGIGKSRLVGEFVTRLGSEASVLAGGCLAAGPEPVPFAPFAAVMRELVRSRGAAELARLLPPRPALARWLPELAAEAGRPEVAPDTIGLFGEILTVLEQLAPVVVVLEDLHWADGSSLQLLAFLAANLAVGDVLLVGTFRPGEAGPLRTTVAELRRNLGVRFLAPEPLTRHEVGRQLAALLAREPEPDLIGRVFKRSGGNPLFVEALSQSPADMSEQLNELLLAFQADLAPAELAVLRAAAVAGSAGSPVGHGLLAAAVDVPALDDAVRSLVSRRLLLAAGSGYEFRHVLVREAVYDDMLPAERAGVHGRLAEALTSRPDLLPPEMRSALLARHAAGAGDLTSALAASWDAAGLAAEIGAYPARLQHLIRVNDLWDQVPARPEGISRLGVLEQIVAASEDAGQIEPGVTAASAALALVDEDREPQRAAWLHAMMASLSGQMGADPGDSLERALALTPADHPTELRAAILSSLASHHVFRGQMAQARDWASAAVQLAEALDAPQQMARGYAFLGLATADDPATSLPWLAKARAAAAGYPQILLMAIACEAAVHVAAGSYREAVTAARDGLRVAQETYRFVESGPNLLVKWVQALVALGEWPDALARIDDALQEPLPPLSMAALQLSRARITLAQGDIPAARTSVAQAGAGLGGESWARMYQLQLTLVRATLARDEGDPDGAARLLGAVTAQDMTPHPHEAWPLVALAAGLRVPLGDLVAELPAASPVDAAYRATARAHIAGTAAAWSAAVRAWDPVTQPYEQAQCQLAAAEAHAAEGDRAAAEEALQAAAATAAGLGAAPLLAAAAQVGRRGRLRLDQPVSEPRRGSLAGLTARELDVLALVSKGLSNRQIAAELFISANTAGVHVSRILAKLGAATRTEAASLARDRGLLGGLPAAGSLVKVQGAVGPGERLIRYRHPQRGAQRQPPVLGRPVHQGARRAFGPDQVVVPRVGRHRRRRIIPRRAEHAGKQRVPHRPEAPVLIAGQHLRMTLAIQHGGIEAGPPGSR